MCEIDPLMNIYNSGNFRLTSCNSFNRVRLGAGTNSNCLCKFSAKLGVHLEAFRPFKGKFRWQKIIIMTILQLMVEAVRRNSKIPVLKKMEIDHQQNNLFFNTQNLILLMQVICYLPLQQFQNLSTDDFRQCPDQHLITQKSKFSELT